MEKDRNLLFAAFLAGAAIIWFLGTRILPIVWPGAGNSGGVAAEEPVLRSGGVLNVAAQESAATSTVFKRRYWTEPPDLSARAALMADVSTGEILMNVNPSLRWPIASITKLMTASIALEELPQSEIVTLTSEDFLAGGNSLTQDLVPGNAYRVSELIKILLVSSSNEAAEALARTYGRERFIARMNAVAAAYGLRDTHFDDPSGLAAANQSTAAELKTFVIEIRKAHPEIFRTTQATSVTVTEVETGKMQIFRSTDQFAGRLGFLGGKTGTTPEAGENLVSIWELAGKPVVVVVFGSSDRFRDTEALITWFNHDFGTGN
jgi:D-alanyl-D-alanine carboxypeptidase